MSGRRTSRRVSTVPIKKPKEEDFVAADAFDFDKEFRSPKGVMTRAKRSSVVLTKPPLTKTKRRQSMMPTVEEKPAKTTVNRRKSLAPLKPASKILHKGIELRNFYESPVASPKTSGGKKISRVDSAKKPIAKKTLELAESPTKKVAPHEKNKLSEAEIMKSLDALLDASPKVAEKKSAKQQPSAAKKKLTTKTPMKTGAKTPMKTPKSNKTPMKTPPASTKRATRNTPAVKNAPKSTIKAPKSTKKVLVTPKVQNLADVKEISIRLKALDNDIIEDPKVLLTQVESLPATPERVDRVVENILSARVSRKRKSDDKDDEITPNKKPRMQQVSAKKTPKSAKKSPAVLKSRPILVAKKTPGLRRAMARTSTLVSTPVQVNPANLLKRNLRTKVETAIDKKIAQKPNSSPYILNQQSNENSPKFEKLPKSTEVTKEVIKAHITGTPVRAARTRKFGTVIQPSLLAADSPVPMTTRRMSSTPLRKRVGKTVATTMPAEIVDSTPIRAPAAEAKTPAREEASSPVVPMSPPGEMFTGKLGKVCVIM